MPHLLQALPLWRTVKDDNGKYVNLHRVVCPWQLISILAHKHGNMTSSPWDLAFSETNIKSGFQKTGMEKFRLIEKQT